LQGLHPCWEPLACPTTCMPLQTLGGAPVQQRGVAKSWASSCAKNMQMSDVHVLSMYYSQTCLYVKLQCWISEISTAQCCELPTETLRAGNYQQGLTSKDNHSNTKACFSAVRACSSPDSSQRYSFCLECRLYAGIKHSSALANTNKPCKPSHYKEEVISRFVRCQISGYSEANCKP